ncbi:MAG: sigma-70 family RNA polymerase sigma factor [SAR202 cluster bacterium]|nr:sigma-70 family RNA polymerase sigma factor [SAR202 cluster bacterium]
MDVKSLTDEALIQAIQRREIQAFEELFDRHHRLCLAVAYKVLGDSSLSEDATQEAFLGLWRSPGSFQPERGALRTWLLSVVRHRAIDMTRGAAFKREKVDLEDVAHLHSSSDVWQQVSRRLDKARIKAAVDTLPAEQKDAILMAFFGGYTYQEIAEKIGAPPLGTVKGRIRLGMNKLRALLGDPPEGASH